MGLDMYAIATAERPDRPVDFKTNAANELHYWRKHPNLHGWMAELYYRKGGQAPEFNCCAVELTSDDLDKLEADIIAGNLPFTVGFFSVKAKAMKYKTIWPSSPRRAERSPPGSPSSTIAGGKHCAGLSNIRQASTDENCHILRNARSRTRAKIITSAKATGNVLVIAPKNSPTKSGRGFSEATTEKI